MTGRRVLSGVLESFLGTYISRNSDYRGYWLFGFVVEEVGCIQCDLLATGSDDDRTFAAIAGSLARRRFAEQMTRWKVDRSRVNSATLYIDRSADQARRQGGGFLRRGYDVHFRATVTSATGRVFHREREVFVAPHSWLLERQRAAPG